MFTRQSFLCFTLYLGICLPVILVSAATDIDECKNSTLNNCSSDANCKNTNGSFECTCKSGYEGDGITCTDINECKNSKLNNCSSDANCKNTNGSFECTCNLGYKGNGIICTDINECKNTTLNNCSSDANCKNTNGSFVCTCNSGYEGNGIICTDINECKNANLNNCSSDANCKNTNGSFECTCNSGYKGDGITCQDINECKNSTLNDCSSEANCKNTNRSFECTCKSGYKGNGRICQDIDECNNSTLNKCSPIAHCQNTNGSYNCHCNPGYDGNGTTCNDINECHNSTLNNCSLVAHCQNTNGSYNCHCNPGYDGNGTTCNDINECLLEQICSPLAKCENQQGNYSCICLEGYKGNGTFCDDIDECKTPLTYCDKNADCKNFKGSYQCSCKERYRGNGKQCKELTLLQYTSAINTSKEDKMYGPYDMYGDIYAFNLFFSTVYISPNGYISLGSDPRISAQPLANYSFPKTVVIFAPFWTPLDLSARGKIYVDNYRRCKDNDVKMLNKVGERIPTFSARRALVITWENVSPYPATEFGNETITFQAVLAASENKLYVMFNYYTENIKMNEDANNRPVLIGYLAGKSKFESVPSDTNIYDWLKSPSEDFAGRRFMKEVGNRSEHSMLCLDWFCANENRTPLANAAVTPCPCTKKQAELDHAFQPNNNKGCFETAFPKNDIIQTCCYDEKWGALLLGYPDGGNTYNKTEDLSIGKTHCCTDYKLCHLFYEIYPSNNCNGYNIPTEVLVWDPLIFNFATGGKSVIFYGSGEYNLIQTNRLQLQARLELRPNIKTPEMVPEIPAYTAFALKFDQNKFEFTINGNALKVTTNVNPSVKVETLSSSKMLVRTPVMQMKVMLIGLNLRVTLFVPASESLTNPGLMSWSLRNGTKLDKSLAKDIYDTFADWKVSNQNVSLFTYTASQNFSTVNTEKVTLEQFRVITANLTRLLQDNIKQSAALCGERKEYCQLEYLLTNTTTILGVEKEQMDNEQILANFPPVFKEVEPTIVVYKNIFMELDAKDPENGSVTIELDTKLKSNTYQFENNKFNLTLHGPMKIPSFVKFYASDNFNASSLYWPEVFLCSCKNKGECQNSSINNKRRLRFLGDNANSEARMYRLPCECEDGYTGQTCEDKIERCTNTACYPSVACNASKPGNPCGPCPSGMEGDGMKCYDIDQCSKNVCSQLCTDFLGNGYKCSCRPGYNLAPDNKTCIDIDECQGVNNCTKVGQYCSNQDGSYSCKCKLGYLAQNESCLSLKGKTKIGGSLVFLTIRNVQVWSEDLKDNSSPEFKQLATSFKDSLLKVLPEDKIEVLEVTSFEKGDPQLTRKKREATRDFIKGNYEAIGTNLDASQIEDSITNGCQETYCDLGNLQGVSRKSISAQAVSLCPNSPCDPVSTNCVDKNGYQCICKHGFEIFAQYGPEHCKDIDECTPPSKPCGDVKCSNTIGSYACVCDFGSVFNNKTKKCDDVCSDSVCNEGICIKNAYNFRCSCKVGWTGEQCDKKDPKSEKMRTNVIIVGAVLGTLCVLLILIIIVMGRRCKSVKCAELSVCNNSETTWSGLPRAHLRDVELNENGSRMDLTKNSNQYDSLPGMLNPAFEHDDNGVERC